MSIEVVDFGSFGFGKAEPSDNEMERLSTAILRAFGEIGFVYLKNTGIEEQNVIKVMDACEQFFILPSDIKHQCVRSMDSEVPNHGWVAAETESLNPTSPGDLKEAFNVSTLSSHIKWPSVNNNSEFRDCLESFFKICEQLSARIMKVITVGLGLERDFFTNKHTMMGIQKSSVKGHQIRCGEHSDYGTFTLLFQDKNGGLEVMHKSGQYIAAPYIPNTILLNTANLLQRWHLTR